MPGTPGARTGLAAVLTGDAATALRTTINTIRDWLEANAAPIASGTLAARPTSTTGTPGVRDRLYYVTGDADANQNDRLWRDTGTGWVEAAAGRPVVTALPGSPIDGQEISYLADGAAGIVWRLKYRAASTSAYKWEVIGGGGLIATATSTVSVTASSYTDATCSLTVPLAGDYDVAHGGLMSYEGGGSGNFSGDGILSYAVGATAAVDADGVRNILPNNGAGLFTWVTGSRENRKTAVPAASALALKLRAAAFINSGGGAIVVRDRFIRATPIRVG